MLFARRISTVLLAAILVAAQCPGARATASSLGVITQVLRASIASAPATNGSSVFDGDSFTTAPDGLLRMRLNAAQVYLAGQSSVQLLAASTGVLARLTRGTMVFSSAKSIVLEVEISEAHIRPASDGPTIAQLSFVSATEIDISARRGALEFSYAGETQLIPEGVAYRFVLNSPAGQPAAAPAQPPFPGQRVASPTGRRNRKFFYFIIGAIAVAAAVAIDEDLESPTKP